MGLPTRLALIASLPAVVPTLLPRAARAGWPDLEVDGPGFCFPVQRWNGCAHVVNPHQYEGKPCRPHR